MGLVYVYLMVPEVAGLSVEEINRIFDGPWFNARRNTMESRKASLEEVIDGIGGPDGNDVRQTKKGSLKEARDGTTDLDGKTSSKL